MKNPSTATLISANNIDFSITWKSILKLLILILLLIGIVVFAATLINEQNDFRKKTEQNQNSTENTSNSTNSKVDIKIDADKKMHQVGEHFNKHGRGMGYTSKKEYGDAALKFAQENSKNPKAKIIEGVWNGGGKANLKEQVAVIFENKTVIIDKISGQLIDFYEGSELRGLINQIILQ